MNHELNAHSTKWIENLAIEEINMEETGMVEFSNPGSIEINLDESSIEVMEEIRELFEIFVTKFNQLRGNSANSKAIKIFKISNTVNDFMLFRNSLKLIVSRKSPDLITVGFMTNSGGFFPTKTNSFSEPTQSIHEIRAHVGAFNEIQWTFQGEKINVISLVKYYLTEFIRLSSQ